MEQDTIFQNYHIFFNTSKCATNYVITFELYDGFIWSNNFEAKKTGKSAIGPWLSCPYKEHTQVDLSSSVGLGYDFGSKFGIYIS